MGARWWGTGLEFWGHTCTCTMYHCSVGQIFGMSCREKMWFFVAQTCGTLDTQITAFGVILTLIVHVAICFMLVWCKTWKWSKCKNTICIKNVIGVEQISRIKTMMPHQKSLIGRWLAQASQWHEICCDDLEDMSLNPNWIELGVPSTSIKAVCDSKMSA